MHRHYEHGRRGNPEFGQGDDRESDEGSHSLQKYYFIRDGLNSVRMIVDPMGKVVQKIDYTPFGEIKGKAKEVMFAYTGREYDSESGLYYYRARYYHPEVGRFISKDPTMKKRIIKNKLFHRTHTR